LYITKDQAVEKIHQFPRDVFLEQVMVVQLVIEYPDFIKSKNSLPFTQQATVEHRLSEIKGAETNSDKQNFG
jgi:hypothetical protein